jgi:hypothetical protein
MQRHTLRIVYLVSFVATSITLAPAEARAHFSETRVGESPAPAGGAQFGFADAFVYCTATPNSTGRPAAIDWTGSLSIADNTFTLLVRSAPPLTTGIFIYGVDTAQYPVGDGFLCVSPFIPGFVALQPGAPPNAAGVVRRRLDFTALSGAGIITPGVTRYFQYMYRDSSPAGVNFSDGLAATFAP